MPPADYGDWAPSDEELLLALWQTGEPVAEPMFDEPAPVDTAAVRARRAFAGFLPSRYPAVERARPNYLAPGDDLLETMTTLFGKGVDGLRAAESGRSVRLRLGDVGDLLAPGGAGAIDLGRLIARLATGLGGGIAGPADPAVTACAAVVEAERRIEEIRRAAGGLGDAAGPRDGAAPEGTHESWANPAALVADRVERQMGSAMSPEGPLAFNVPDRSDGDRVIRHIQTFELRDGPSDVTSYHDFASLQIAFEHVWTEVFDGRLRSLGEDLYQEYVRLKQVTGTDDGDDRRISTLDDLGGLLAEIRELSRMAPDDADASTPSGGGAMPSGGGVVSDLARTALAADPLQAVPKPVRTFVDPGGALIGAVLDIFAGKDHLTWQSFPGPLRQGDVITVAIQQNAVPAGNVEIVVRNTDDTWWWKGIEFTEFGPGGQVIADRQISTDGPSSLRIRPAQLVNGVLEFQKRNTIFNDHTGFYLLSRLDERLQDRARVTFTWIRD